LKNALTTIFYLLFSMYLLVSAPAWAKPCWVVPVEYENNIDKWEIDSSGNISTTGTSTTTSEEQLTGMAVDSDTNTLFVVFERGNGGIEVLNGTTLLTYGLYYTGIHGGFYDMIGLAVDSTNNLLYTIEREYNQLYVYHYDDASPWVLTLEPGYPVTLPGLSGAAGITLDDVSGYLYVADTLSSSNRVRKYNTTTWALVASITVPVNPIGVAFDRSRGFLYTTCADTGPPEGDCLPCLSSFTSSKLICKYDTNTGSTYTATRDYGCMGVAVNETTGNIYVTGGCNGDNITVYNSNLALLQTTARIGDPGAIVIPQYADPGEIKGINQVFGLAVEKSGNSWEFLKDAAAGDNLSSGAGACQMYLYDPNTMLFNRSRGESTNGTQVSVTVQPPSGGSSQYCIKRTNIDPNSTLIPFGFESMNVTVTAVATNTADVVIDWIGGSAVSPVADTAGDDLLPPGRVIHFDLYKVTGLGVKSVSGTQTISIRALK
jgi:DNA-binding beta-propeller fold protein YncE